MGRYRPWLAAFLALLVAGLGHAYLRRWRRAFMWFGWIFGTGLLLTAFFADSATADPVVLAPEILLPLVVLFLMSAVDAFRLGRADRRPHSPQESQPTTDEAPSDAGLACPYCGKEIDPDLDFCSWCTERLPQNDEATELR